MPYRCISMTTLKVTTHLNESSESSQTTEGSNENSNPRRGLGTPQYLSTTYDDLGAGEVVDGGIEWTPRDVRQSEIRQRVSQRSRDQANYQIGLIRAALQEANRAVEAERRSKEAWARKEEEERRAAREAVNKVKESRRKENDRKSKVEEERIRVKEEELWSLEQEEVSAAATRVAKRVAERKKDEAEEERKGVEEEKRKKKRIQEVKEADSAAKRDKSRKEEEEREVERVAAAVEAGASIAAARGSAEARGAAKIEENTEEKSKPLESEEAASKPEKNGQPNYPGIELTLSKFEKDSDTAGDEIAQVELGVASSSPTPRNEGKFRESEDDISDETTERNEIEVIGAMTHFSSPEAQNRIPAAAGITRASDVRVDGAARIDIISEDRNSNNQSKRFSPAKTVEAIMIDA